MFLCSEIHGPPLVSHKATWVAYIGVVLKAAFTTGSLFSAGTFTCAVLELRIPLPWTLHEYSHSFEGDTINLNY